MRRVALVVAAVLLAAGATPAQGSSQAASQAPVLGTLVLSGSGGQQLELEVSERTLDLELPLDSTPRMAGPDGTVGGVLLQRQPNMSLRGALLLTNVPGFTEAVGTDLIGQGIAHLPQGRYVVTLLGSGPQHLTFGVRGRQGRTTLSASGPGRSITRSSFGAAPAVDAFSEDFEIRAPVSILAMSIGSGGGAQQASSREWCISRAASRADVCTFSFHSTRSTSVGSVGGATWETYPLYGALRREPFVFSGRSLSAGGTTASHAVVVIDVPQPPQ